MRRALDNDKVKEKASEDEVKTVNEKIDALLESVKFKKYDELDTKKADVEAAFKPISDKVYQQPKPEETNTNQQYQQAGFNGDATTANETNESQFGTNAQEAEFEEVDAEEVKD